MQTTVAERETITKALRRLGGRATVGDVVAQTGVSRDAAELSLRELLGEFRGHLAVGEKGDLVYEFEPKLIRHGRVSWWRRFRRTAKRVLAAAFKAWIVLMLVAYFVVFVALLVAAVVAAISGDRRGSRRSHRIRIPTFWIWYLFWTRNWHYGRPYYGHRWERRQADRVPFYKKVFAFVFGPDRPRPDPAERDRALLALIRSRNGVLSTAELVEHTGLSTGQAAEEMARLLGAWSGDVRVAGDGDLVYVFPELMVSAHGGVREKRPEPAWRRLERPLEVTGNEKRTNAIIGALNGFNLLASATAPWIIFPRFGFGGPAAWIGLVAIPLSFSAIFFAIPAARRLGILRENRNRSRRNIRKALLSVVYRTAVEERTVTVTDATDWVRLALEDPTVEEGAVLEALEWWRSGFDGAAEIGEDGSPRFAFPRLRAQLAAAEQVRSILRLGEQRVGEIVYSSGDSAAEDSRRALAAFDAELRRRLPRTARAAYVDDFEVIEFGEEPR